MDGALFVDAGNLNVLFKVNGKFCLGANYQQCPLKLATDAQALGSGFDIYISLWPRQHGEGDAVIPSLSIGGVPFEVLKEEVDAIFALADSIPGAGSIYLCNAMANFAIPSRVGNYKAVVPYGTRYALITSESNMLAALDVFDSQLDFFAKMGDDYQCYGDLDIIDVDTIRAQYPELEEFKKNVLVPLVPLIVSYRSAYKVSKEDACAEMASGKLVREPTPPPPAEEKKEAPIPEPEEVPRPAPKRKQKEAKPPVDFVTLALGFVFCAAMLINGICFSMRNVTSHIDNYNSLASQAVSNKARYDNAIRVYGNQFSEAAFSAEVLEYAKSTELPITIASLNCDTDRIFMVCNCQDADEMQNFITYLQRRFVVEQPNEMDRIANSDGTITIQYGVTVVPD